MFGIVKLPFRRFVNWMRWRNEDELLDAAVAFGMSPVPADRYRAGETPSAFRARLRLLVLKHTQPLETPEWMLPANVDEFLARTRPGG